MYCYYLFQEHTFWAKNPNWAMCFLCACYMVVFCTAKDVEDSPIIHENYGVTFHSHGVLDNAHSVWHQTFVIPLNQDDIPTPNLFCTGMSPDGSGNVPNNIQYLCPALQAYNDRHLRLHKDIHQSQNNINQLLQKLQSKTK